MTRFRLDGSNSKRSNHPYTMQSSMTTITNNAMFVWMRAFFLLLFIITTTTTTTTKHLALALPSGFVDEGVASVNAPTGFSFAPRLDGNGYMMLVAEKGGSVWVLPNPEESDEEIRSLDFRNRICTNQERGIQSVVAHPDFLENRYVYVFYAWPKFGNCDNDPVDGPVNRLARFVMMDNLMLDEDSEEILLETSSLFNKIHNGGDMHFGKDGYLYVSLGDAGDRTTNAQALDILLGSMLRITADGGIPPGNPYTSRNGYTSARCSARGVPPRGSPDGTVCEEIFATGLRNPFRFAMDPNTPDGVVRAFINDVGGNAWEETSELVIGGNYGWPLREGPCELDSVTSCAPTNNEFLDPVYWYGHSDEGGAAVGCTFIPNGIWPAEYDNAFMYMDFVFWEIYVLRENPSNYCRTCNPPRPGWERTVFHSWEWPVSMTFGPFRGSQALYYAVRGTGYNNIRRIYYVGGNNDAPIAVLDADTTQGLVGSTIRFDASESSDPNFDALTFDWDFGDGSTLSDGPSIVSHRFRSLGQFVVTVTVSDDGGFSDEAYLDITIGDKPTVTITSPSEGTEFAVGDILTLVGSARDSFGNAIPSDSLTWEVRQHHNTHFHPFLDLTQGNNIAISPAPEPEDFLASTNSYLEVILTAVDSNGVSETVNRLVMPKMVTMQFDSEPSGLEILLDDYTVTTPIEVITWENHRLKVEAQDQSPWLWMSWSNGESQRHTINVPASTDTMGVIMAMFSMAPSEQPSLSMTAAPSTTPPTTNTPTETVYVLSTDIPTNVPTTDAPTSSPSATATTTAPAATTAQPIFTLSPTEKEEVDQTDAPTETSSDSGSSSSSILSSTNMAMRMMFMVGLIAVYIL